MSTLRGLCDLINSSAVIRPGRITAQRAFAVINKLFAHTGSVLFKSIEGLFTPLDLVLKKIDWLHIFVRVFDPGISLPVRFDQELKSSVGRQNRRSIRVTNICLKN